jgi:NAD(P)-dependent dehydrogenase (short-subunit alcohol dehydrogenase family)
LTLDEWRWTFSLNAEGPFLCTRACLRERYRRPIESARIVLFSSIGGQIGGRMTGPAYVAAKAGLIGYARALAQEVASSNITVNTIAPGSFDTPAYRAAVTDAELAAATQRSLLGRFGDPAECAHAVSYLLSSAAGFVTGSVLDVNGGARMQ